MLAWINDPSAWVALVTLTVLELVLGIDNIIFISILAGKLPPTERDKARRLGLILAMVTRILLLLSITWLAKLTTPLFTISFLHHSVSGRDLVLGIGGLWLFLFFRNLAGRALVPVRDPYLKEALAHGGH